MADATVTVDPYDMVVPECCACCGAPAGDELPVVAYQESTDWRATLVTMWFGAGVVHEEETTFLFPYCGDCVKHQKAHETAWIAGVVPGAIVTALGLWLWGFPSCPAWQTFAWFGVGTVVIVAGKMAAQPFFAEKGENCARDFYAVAAEGPLKDGRYRFHFANKQYAKAFTKLNKGE